MVKFTNSCGGWIFEVLVTSTPFLTHSIDLEEVVQYHYHSLYAQSMELLKGFPKLRLSPSLACYKTRYRRHGDSTYIHKYIGTQVNEWFSDATKIQDARNTYGTHSLWCDSDTISKSPLNTTKKCSESQLFCVMKRSWNHVQLTNTLVLSSITTRAACLWQSMDRYIDIWTPQLFFNRTK